MRIWSLKDAGDYRLSEFEHIPPGIRKGRSVRDGYARGWGLQFGDLRAKVSHDSLYRDALAMASGRTLQQEENRMNLFLLLKFFLADLPGGHVAEFGTYRGGSAIFLARVCQALHPETRVYAFDTFEGMPATDASVDAHREGDFRDVDLEELQSYAEQCELTNLHFVKGRFEDTCLTTLRAAGRLRLAHIDCDIKSAVEYSYEVSKELMVDGGYIALDDPLFSSCLGATEAVEDVIIRRDGLNSEQIYPQFVFRIFR